MIPSILKMLENQLNDYIKTLDDSVVENQLILGNIAQADGTGGYGINLQGKVVLSLVNIMEEATLKNSSSYVDLGGRFELENPPIFINLFLLFSANYLNTGNISNDTQYLKGLTRLSQIIAFFQSKHVFTIKNSPSQNAIDEQTLYDYKVSMELFTMTFEQVNHLWGSLGGKQVPFVMYKAGILPIKRKYTIQRGGYIKDIKTDTNSK